MKNLKLLMAEKIAELTGIKWPQAVIDDDDFVQMVFQREARGHCLSNEDRFVEIRNDDA